MNGSVKFQKVLEELRHNIDVDGHPPSENSEEGFCLLCEYVTNWMVRKYDLEFDSDINHGYCFIWAYLVWALWPHGGITFLTTTGHVVIKYGDRFYDSDHQDGLKSTVEFWSFYDGAAEKHIEIKTMCWYWARAGRQFKEFRRLLRKVQPALYNSVRDNGNNYWKNSLEDFVGYEEIENLPELIT